MAKYPQKKLKEPTFFGGIMLNWLENSKNNLLPLSVSTEFHEALKEWFFANEIKDYQKPCKDCQMCEHTGLRYHFLIRNRRSEKILWVGSSCILKFYEIDVFNEDNSVAKGKEREKRLDEVVNEFKKEQALKPLRLLWKQDKNYRDSIARAVEHFEEKGGFKPKFLAIMMARMSNRQISYDPSVYPVYLRSKKAKCDLEEMSLELFEFILPALSVSQRKRWFHLIEKKCAKSEASAWVFQEQYGPPPEPEPTGYERDGYIWVDGIPI